MADIVSKINKAKTDLQSKVAVSQDTTAKTDSVTSTLNEYYNKVIEDFDSFKDSLKNIDTLKNQVYSTFTFTEIAALYMDKLKSKYDEIINTVKFCGSAYNENGDINEQLTNIKNAVYSMQTDGITDTKKRVLDNNIAALRTNTISALSNMGVIDINQDNVFPESTEISSINNLPIMELDNYNAIHDVYTENISDEPERRLWKYADSTYLQEYKDSVYESKFAASSSDSGSSTSSSASYLKFARTKEKYSYETNPLTDNYVYTNGSIVSTGLTRYQLVTDKLSPAFLKLITHDNSYLYLFYGYGIGDGALSTKLLYKIDLSSGVTYFLGISPAILSWLVVSEKTVGYVYNNAFWLGNESDTVKSNISFFINNDGSANIGNILGYAPLTESVSLAIQGDSNSSCKLYKINMQNKFIDIDSVSVGSVKIKNNAFCGNKTDGYFYWVDTDNVLHQIDSSYTEKTLTTLDFNVDMMSYSEAANKIITITKEIGDVNKIDADGNSYTDYGVWTGYLTVKSIDMKTYEVEDLADDLEIGNPDSSELLSAFVENEYLYFVFNSVPETEDEEVQENVQQVMSVAKVRLFNISAYYFVPKVLKSYRFRYPRKLSEFTLQTDTTGNYLYTGYSGAGYPDGDVASVTDGDDVDADEDGIEYIGRISADQINIEFGDEDATLSRQLTFITRDNITVSVNYSGTLSKSSSSDSSDNNVIEYSGTLNCTTSLSDNISHKKVTITKTTVGEEFNVLCSITGDISNMSTSSSVTGTTREADIIAGCLCFERLFKENSHKVYSTESVYQIATSIFTITDYINFVDGNKISTTGARLLSDACDCLENQKDQIKTAVFNSLNEAIGIIYGLITVNTIYSNDDPMYVSDYTSDIITPYSELQSTITDTLASDGVDILNFETSKINTAFKSYFSSSLPLITEKLKSGLETINEIISHEFKASIILGSEDISNSSIPTTTNIFRNSLIADNSVVASAEVSGYVLPSYDIQDFTLWQNNIRNIFVLNISSITNNAKEYLRKIFDGIYSVYVNIIYTCSKIIGNIENKIWMSDIIDILNEERINEIIDISKSNIFLKVPLNKDDIISRNYNNIIQKAFNLENILGIRKIKYPNTSILNPFVINDDKYAAAFNNVDIEEIFRDLSDTANLNNNGKFQNILAFGYLDVMNNYFNFAEMFDRITNIYYDSDNSKFRSMSIRDLVYLYSMNNAAKVLVSGNISMSSDKADIINNFIKITEKIEEYLKDFITVYKYFYIDVDEITDVVPQYLKGFLV